jgi:site-specific recombinase XerD
MGRSATWHKQSSEHVAAPVLHSFRRGFALNSLRNGMDDYSLQNLMGQSDLQILGRYLKQPDGDLQAAHWMASPVDRLG